MRHGHIGVAQLVKQLVHVLLGLGHGLVQRLVGIAIFAEQLGNSQAGVDNVHDVLRVVELTADAARVVRHIQLATDVTVVQVLHHRHVGRRLEVQKPAFAVAFLLGVLTEHLLGVVVQTGQQALVLQEHRPGVGGLQHILTVSQGQLTQLGAQFAVGLLVLGTQVSTVVGETLVDIVQHLGLLGRQFQFGALVIHGFDALEQTLVQTNRGAVLRQAGRHLGLDSLQFVAGVGAGQVEQAGQRHVQQFA